jgi:hypothetical protein
MSDFNPLDAFLTRPVLIRTKVEQQISQDEEGNVETGMVSYGGTLIDHNEIWACLGYYDDKDEPVYLMAVKIDDILNIEVISEHGEAPNANDVN